MDGEETKVERNVMNVSDVTSKPEADKTNLLAKKYSYKKVGSNEIFRISPEVLNFAGFFELNKTYTMKAKIINSSNQPKRVHILPSMTPYFRIKAGKNLINNNQEIYIQFNPVDYKYYYDCVRIHCEGDQKLLLPIHAYPVINRSKDRLLPKLVNMAN